MTDEDEGEPVALEVEYELDPLIVAVSLEKARESYEKYYEEKGLELHEDEPDAHQLWDWIGNNMDYEDFEGSKLFEIVGGPMVHRDRDFPDFEEEWGDATKRLIDYDGNVLMGDG